MDNSNKGITESLLVLEAIKDIAIPVKKTLADHKVDASDIPNAMELIKNHQVFVDAVEGAGNLVGEAKDYDISELAQIGAKVLEVIKAIQAA